MYNWYQNIFHAIAVLIVFHAANEKTGRKQDLKKTANQERKIKTLLPSPIHLAHHHSAVAPLSHCYRYAVALLLPRCCTAIAPLPFRCRDTAFAPLLRCCKESCCLVLILFSLGFFVCCMKNYQYYNRVKNLVPIVH